MPPARAYVDTSVIVSYIDEADPNHERALALVKGLSGGRVVSKLTLVELASVYSMAGLEEPLPLVVYSVRSVGAEVVEVDFSEALRDAIVKAPTLKLRTLDLIHIMACRSAGCKEFVTLDSDIAGRAGVIDRELGIKVVSRPTI
jgi:predicted nucleic acid-binding protein